jgi:hypothetical protein
MNEDKIRLIEEVKKKKEFSGLPDSVVWRALIESGKDVKEARKILRKYFGVFLTNRVLKGKGLLGSHLSSKKRDYEEFYSKIFEEVGDVRSVVDLGCGVNGFSYEFLPNDVSYFGVEAAGQLVNQMNSFFDENGFAGEAICGDLFDLGLVDSVLEGAENPKVVFLFQVVDALESMKRDFSKELISFVMKNCDFLVISLPLFSLGGRKKFAVDRKWLVDWLKKNFSLKKDFELFGERILVVS